MYRPFFAPPMRRQLGAPAYPDPPAPVTPAPGPSTNELPPGFVAPGPTPLPDNWERQWHGLDEQPYAVYEVKMGDTLVGITKTYLDASGQRWREIYALNTDLIPNPDELYPGDQLRVPEEVRTNVRAWLRGDVPGELPSANKGKTSVPWWAVIGGTGAAAAALYWMW